MQNRFRYGGSIFLLLKDVRYKLDAVSPHKHHSICSYLSALAMAGYFSIIAWWVGSERLICVI